MAKRRKRVNDEILDEPQDELIEEEKEEVKEEVKELVQVEEPKEIPQLVPLRVFATVAGPKWDQIAGFVSYARRMKLENLTMKDWRAEYSEFLKRPM